MAVHNGSRAELTQYLESFNLQWFGPDELLIGCDRPGNSLPRRELWPNIKLAALVLDVIRARFDRPAIVTSTFRARAYNARVGGSPTSQHQAFCAIDFVMAGTSPREVARHARSLRGVPIPGFRAGDDRVPVPGIEFKEISDSKFQGGVGDYSNFCHLDTRGCKRDWSGK